MLVASGLSPNFGYLEFGFDNSMFIVNSTVAAPVRRLDEPNGPISVFVSLGRGSEGIRFDRNQVFNGNLYVSTWWDDQIWSVDSNGNQTVLVAQISTPGLGSVTTDIDFTKPGSQFEKDGKPWLYAVDQGGKITRVDAAGNLELFTNGPGSEVLRFSKPGSLFGDYIYIAPYTNQILRIDANGNVSVFATGFAGSDPASTGIEFSNQGDVLYFTDNNGTLYAISPASTLVVQGFDQSRSQIGFKSGESFSFVTGPPFASARSLLASNFSVTFLSGVPLVTPAALQGVDVFVINPISGALSPAEICALETFVNNGGTLLETRNLRVRPPILGTVPGPPRGESVPTIVNPSSPLISGPFGTSSNPTMGFNYSFSQLGDAVAVTANSAGPNIIQMSEGFGRTGRAAFMGDEELFMTGSFSGERAGQLGNIHNQRLLLNTFAFLEGAPGLDPNADFASCVNIPPISDAGPDQTEDDAVECTSPTGTSVTLDGSGSFDPDNGPSPLSYSWTGPFPEGSRTVNGVNPTVTLGL